MSSESHEEEAIDAANAGDAASRTARETGLPAVSPDIVEQTLGGDMDSIVPSPGYGMTPTVCLGGSAGGIQALTEFFDAMPADSGLVFVVVLHLSPEHVSTLPALLGRHTAMPVVQVEDAMAVEANRVYVIPPGKHLLSVDGHLKLVPLDSERGKRVAVDCFCRTLPVPTGPNTLALSANALERAAERPAWPPGFPPAAGTVPTSEVQLRLLAQFGPPVLIVNAQEDIIHLSGAAARYLQFDAGTLTRNLLQAIHPMLRIELRAVLYRAHQDQQPAEAVGIPVDLGDQRQAVDLHVSSARDLAPGHLVISILPSAVPTITAADRSASVEADPVARQLEHELDALKSHLRDLTEEHDTAIEEHKAGSEELRAMNEELRSAGEELETGREELQSINEELLTVNHELESRVEQLGHANSDLHNLMNATTIASVFVDREMRITRYTPAATALFNLIPSDRGRKLSDLRHHLDYPDLDADADQVLAQLIPVEREVGRTGGGGWFLARLLPYRTLDDHIAGLVLTFVDITLRKGAEHALRESEKLRRIALSGGRMGTWRWDLRQRQVRGDAEFLALWGVPPSDESYPASIFVDNLTAEGKAAMEAVMSGETAPGEEFDKHFQLASGPGAGRWVRWRGRAEHDTPWIVNGVSFDVTEQQHADTRRRASEEQFRTFVAATSDTVYKMSADWSEMRHLQGKRFLADTADPSRSWLEEYIPADEQARVWAAIQAAVRDKHSFELEHRVIRADGTPGWAFSRAIPLLDGRGEISEWIGAASEVTERKQAEEAARGASARLRAIADTAPALIWETDASGVVFVNRHYLDFFGRDFAALQGMGWTEFLHPEDAQGCLEAYQRAFAQGEPYQHECRFRRVDGEDRWLLNLGRPFDPGHFVGCSVDITENKRTAQALSVSEERLHLVLDSARDFAIYTVDEEGVILSWNSGAEALFGHPVAGIIGRSTMEFCTPEDRAARVLHRELATARSEGRASSERWHCRKDGTRFFGSGSVVPLNVDAAGRAGFLIILSDRTQAREVEDALEEHRQQLLAALQQNEHARAEVEAASRAKDHFLAVLSHELRTPLTPITMTLAILDQRTDLPEAVCNALAMIERNVKLEAHFIDDLMDMTRISRGKMEIVLADMDLHQAIERAVEVCAPDLAAKKQSLTVELDATETRLDGDFARLQQVLWNLLKNASKFTPEGGAIRLRSRHEPGWIFVEITDTGIGMDAEVLERIFNAFEQADAAITREFGGLGLGLAIARATVETHGGQLRAGSPGRGQGATFTVSLPLIPASENG